MNEKKEFIRKDEIPANPSFRANKTYMAIAYLNIKPSWYAMSREERIRLTRKHMDELKPFSDRVARTHLTATGLGKFDTIQILEAEDLADISRMIRVFRAGAKAAHMELVDVMIGVKGMGDLLEE